MMNKQILPRCILMLAVIASTTQAWTPPDLGSGFSTQVQAVLDMLIHFICWPACIIIDVVSGLAALAFMFAGLRYLAADDPGTRSQMRGFMVNIIVGLVLVLLAIPIVNYVVTGLLHEVQCDCITAPISNINTVLCGLICTLTSIGPPVCALVMLYGGLRYVTSSEDPGARSAARTIIINALVGLVFILLAVPIVNMLITDILTKVQCGCFEDLDPAAQINMILCNFICFVATVAPAICALVTLYGGLKWLTSGDDTGARNAAKNTIIAALAGIVIVMLAVPVVNMLIGAILPQTVRCDCLPDLDPVAQISLVLCNLICLFANIAPAIAALAMLYGGLRWVVSVEDPEARSAAKKTIIAALVGLIFVLISVPVVNIVLSNLSNQFPSVQCGCFNIGDPAEQISKILCNLACTLQEIIPPVAALVIAYGGLKYLTSGEDPGARATARSIVINAIVGLVISLIAIQLVNIVLVNLFPTFECNCANVLGDLIKTNTANTKLTIESVPGNSDICNKCCNATRGDSECHATYSDPSGNKLKIDLSGSTITKCSYTAKPGDPSTYLLDIETEETSGVKEVKSGSVECVTCSDGTVPGRCNAGNYMCEYTSSGEYQLKFVGSEKCNGKIEVKNPEVK